LLPTGFGIGPTELKVVAPGSLDARNTLENPAAVQPVAGEVQVERQVVRCALPALSAAVLSVEKR
jgi:hypothetical protein